MNNKSLSLNFFSAGMLLLFSCITQFAFGTHNRAGEITYEHISGNTYRAKIVTYTKINPPAPDRAELEIFWGDGQNDTIARTSSVPVAADIKRNEYFGIHTYSGSGVYTIYFIDENRNAGVLNIPGSVNVPFYVETQLIINASLGLQNIYNNTPVLLEPPIDDGVVNQLFIHNPSAFDPDGDSLSYELTVCKGTGGGPVPGYSLPIGPNSSITVDPYTGDFIWNSPQQTGIYNFAFIIREWKQIPGIGRVNLGYVTRDFQVNITTVQNAPPQIFASDTCVEAGTLLLLDAYAIEPDNEQVSISATGGPFLLSVSPAIPDTSDINVGSVTYNFKWQTTCAHVRKLPYQVIFKAVDYNNLNVQLSDVQSVFIQIIGPAPKNPAADASGNGIKLHWNPGGCSNTAGYYIYRKVNLANYTPAYCVTGVPPQTGYVRIGQTTGINDTTFNDNNNGQGLATGLEYCYMITARFPDGAEGYPSVEVCASLRRDLPVITNADVLSTSTTNGSIYIAWTPPTELDTIQYQGPYSYTLQRSVSGGNFVDVVTLNNWNDTIFTDSNLNTKDNQYSYRVRFNYNGGTFLGQSQVATTVYLTAAPGDNKVRLTWNYTVPWSNTLVYIYRSESGSAFTLIDSTSNAAYTDYTALNTIEYCYYIQTSGLYSTTGYVYPILNRSQEDCAIPIDNEAPCPPVLNAVANCDSSTIAFNWTYGNVPDCKTDDIAYFTVYFSSVTPAEFDSVGYFETDLQEYLFERGLYIGGCYYLTATDTNGNVTDSSNSVCIESCPIYELPNLFTPDNNGINDYFTPIEDVLTGLFFRDIASVDMKIYNRWGGLVFKTNDPEIRWNGKKNNDGEEVPEGVYYYTCIVYITNMTEEMMPLKLHGTVVVSRGGTSQ